MKLTCCFFASALAKSVTQVLEDLTAITSRFNAMTNERSATFPPNKDLLDAVMTWQTDMLEVENNGKDLKRALASGSNLNLQILLSTLLGEDQGERYGNENGADKFSTYGCYCSPHHGEMQDGLWLGKGQAVDGIDGYCKDLWNGYKCLKQDYGENCDSTRTYNWEISDKGKPICLDGKGTCLGALCRVDLEYASAVQAIQHTWNPDYHMNNGFDRFTVCGSSHTAKETNFNGIKQGECCGKGLTRHTFNPSKLECCKDGSTKKIGAC